MITKSNKSPSKMMSSHHSVGCTISHFSMASIISSEDHRSIKFPPPSNPVVKIVIKIVTVMVMITMAATSQQQLEIQLIIVYEIHLLTQISCKQMAFMPKYSELSDFNFGSKPKELCNNHTYNRCGLVRRNNTMNRFRDPLETCAVAGGLNRKLILHQTFHCIQFTYAHIDDNNIVNTNGTTF